MIFPDRESILGHETEREICNFPIPCSVEISASNQCGFPARREKPLVPSSNDGSSIGRYAAAKNHPRAESPDTLDVSFRGDEGDGQRGKGRTSRLYHARGPSPLRPSLVAEERRYVSAMTQSSRWRHHGLFLRKRPRGKFSGARFGCSFRCAEQCFAQMCSRSCDSRYCDHRSCS